MRDRADASGVRDLFGDPETDRPASRQDSVREDAPLAERMRPRELADMVGQDEVLGPGRPLRGAIERDELRSLILWGPPGSGKTTLARVIRNRTHAHFEALSALHSGVKDVREVLRAAETRRRAQGRRTVLFIDEIHRFNKAQQDALLAHVESGDVVLVGATTENPSFEVNSALLSRSRLVVLKPLDEAAIGAVLQRALAEDAQLRASGVAVGAEALAFLARASDGDARTALNVLELAVAAASDGTAPTSAESVAGAGAEEFRPGGAPAGPDDGTHSRRRPPDGAGAEEFRPGGAPAGPDDGISRRRPPVDLVRMRDAFARKALQYDRAGEEHFNLISALHKALRNSDADAALYWLARMLEAGEDPLYVARRLVRFASEDVGLAEPGALVQCVAAQQAVHLIGLPEGALALAQAACYLAAAPKSNALYVGYGEAARDALETRAEPVPLHLRNAPTRLMKDLGYGAGYRYAHDEAEGVAAMSGLPEALATRRYYRPTERGREKEYAARLEAARLLRERPPSTGGTR